MFPKDGNKRAPCGNKEQAFAGSMRGLCAPLVQDCINRMLIVVLRDRRNPAKPFNVFITEECIELKEEVEQAGGKPSP
eukprot:33689-Eustigmatos_ZCMA.PRE.1